MSNNLRTYLCPDTVAVSGTVGWGLPIAEV